MRMNTIKVPRFFWVSMLVFALYTGSRALMNLYPDYLWFKDLGYTQVYLTRYLAQFALGTVAFVLVLLLWAINLLWVRRNVGSAGARASADPRFSQFENVIELDAFRRAGKPQWGPALLRTFALLGLVVALVLAFGFSGSWMDLLLALKATPFATVDPIFHRDIGFYVFVWPYLQQVLGFGIFALAISIVGTLVLYGMAGLFHVASTVTKQRVLPTMEISPKIWWHLATLTSLLLALLAAQTYLGLYDILFSNRGAAYGASYTDVAATLLGGRVVLVLYGAAALAALYSAYRKRLGPVLTAIGGVLVVSILLRGVYPNLIHQYVVKPNEYNKEKPYIQYSIENTLRAYGLDHIKQSQFPAEDNLSAAALERNRVTVENIRLWDHRPLLKTFAQLQEIRLYYDFLDVDVDRYLVDGKQQQVMLSAREFNPENLNDKAKSWVNLHLAYTHGYGAVVSPVNRVSSEGLPDFFVKDIPPVESKTEFKITRPEIYFGEAKAPYIFVNAADKEFDYPAGDQNQFTRYQGSAGVPLGSLMRRSILAYTFGDFKILISPSLSSDTKLVWRRNVLDRVKTIAPFIRWESDPYLVIHQGRLVWMIDGYTTSGSYPCSQPVGDINYIRNSVKAVVDAYNGTVDFYQMDKQDPIARTLQAIYPGFFKDFSSMPKDLQAHVRYPEGLFKIQTQVYSTYHMKDPQVFYNREDVWEIPIKQTVREQGVMEPFYLNMRLPGQNNDSFILLLPFTPSGKGNMIAWMSAQCNLSDYGQLMVYDFPKQRQVFGPAQVESRIDQNTEISQQLSLWDQAGSSVIRGSLIVIPIETSLLYIEPIYLQGTSGQLPELKRVIVGYNNNVVMRETLDEALRDVFAGQVNSSSVSASSGNTPLPTVAQARATIQEAWSQYQSARAALRKEDFGAYGKAMDQLGKVLEQLKK